VHRRHIPATLTLILLIHPIPKILSPMPLGVAR
jgi:hypothetical protein